MCLLSNASAQKKTHTKTKNMNLGSPRLIYCTVHKLSTEMVAGKKQAHKTRFELQSGCRGNHAVYSDKGVRNHKLLYESYITTP